MVSCLVIPKAKKKEIQMGVGLEQVKVDYLVPQLGKLKVTQWEKNLAVMKEMLLGAGSMWA